MSTEVIGSIREELAYLADEKIRETSRSFFKEPIACYGVKTSDVNKIARAYYSTIKDRSKQEIFSLCEELLKSDYMEEASIACEWSYNLHDKYEPADFTRF
jgi:3-methyladenine DNA glycosylase AlkD